MGKALPKCDAKGIWAGEPWTCDRKAGPGGAGGKCSGHYQQLQRGGTLKPLKFARGDGESDQVAFRAPADLLSSVEKAAKREGIDPSEWWRRAGRERLER